MVDILVTTNDTVTLLNVAGRIDSSNANELGDVLNAQIDSGAFRFVLDLSALDYMSSAGLRELVSALKRVRREQGDIRLAGPSSRVYEVLEMAGLDTIFQIFHSQAEALDSY